jgi:molybdenum cofactor biosynthesis enzyme MoaA
MAQAGFREATVEALADLMRSQKDLGFSTCVLLGAGVSVSAGIPDASGIVHELKRRFPGLLRSVKQYSYADSMESLPVGVRRQLIRTYIARAKLNTAHLCLAALVKEGYVDRVLTTNFDPLIEKSLALQGCRPTVYDFASAHEFVAEAVPPRSLFYLHGRSDGFLLLNTESEINSLADSLRPLFEDSNRARAWLVVGYGGGDKPVFDQLVNLGSYEYGLYWVGYKGRNPPEHVKQGVLPKEGTHFVRAETADAFFRELTQKLDIETERYSRPKTPVDLESVDTVLTEAGIAEAADLFDVPQSEIKCIACRVFNDTSGASYLHRVFIRNADFRLIEEEFRKNNTINIIKTLLAKKRLSLCLRKTHQFIPTLVGRDSDILDTDASSPAMLHAQVSYVESTDTPSARGAGAAVLCKPVELLVTKYTTPVNIFGYLLDRAPRREITYSKAAEDLYQKREYQEEVVKAVEEYFVPFSRINLSLAQREGDRLLLMPCSAKPERLLRILVVPEDICNYDCGFCCLPHGKSNQRVKPNVPRDRYRAVIAGFLKSGCTRVMLTGGEPLLSEKEVLLECVKVISSSPDLTDFWICTNGSLLNKRLCRQLNENGLRKLVLTIPAETNEKYHVCTGQDSFDLDDILDRLTIASREGLHVRVDVPLSRPGIKNIKEFLNLAAKVREAGTAEMAFFQLHKSEANKAVFDDLFVSSDLITWELARDNAWRVKERENGQRVFHDGSVDVIIPACIDHETENCKRSNCGPYCQGIYATYLTYHNSVYTIRGCHRPLRNNTFELHENGLHRERVVSRLLDRVWHWAYQPTPVEKRGRI